MDILDTLRFVQGAVSTKDLIPEMKHFVIEKGAIRAFNGILALSSPIDFELDCAPKAVSLVQAIRNCSEVTTLGMTETGKLRIRSGPFRAFIECVDIEGLPHQQPDGQVIDINGQELVDAFKTISPFIGNDASRPFVNGILLRDQSAFATNNVCLVEYWIGSQFPFTVNIPTQAIKEILRIGTPPIKAQVSTHSITFHYPDGKWIRSQLLETNWPDLRKILDVPHKAVKVPDSLYPGLEAIKPFLDKNGLVYFRDGFLHTSAVDDIGAKFEVPGLAQNGVYKLVMLSLLKDVAIHADFSAYPKPTLFFGNRLRGAVVGLKI